MDEGSQSFADKQLKQLMQQTSTLQSQYVEFDVMSL